MDGRSVSEHWPLPHILRGCAGPAHAPDDAAVAEAAHGRQPVNVCGEPSRCDCRQHVSATSYVLLCPTSQPSGRPPFVSLPHTCPVLNTNDGNIASFINTLNL